jgi:peptide/nickel transport system permease protein
MTVSAAPRKWLPIALAALVAFLVLLTLLGADYRAIDLEDRLRPPLSGSGLLGTDELGRDVAARIARGLGWSLAIATASTAIAFIIGTTFGLVAARQESLLGGAMRLLTTFTQAFPPFVLAVAVIAVAGEAGFTSMVLTLGLITWPVFSRVVYAEARSLFAREYVIAAQMMGLSRGKLYLRHILPSLVPSLSVLAVFHFADMIIAESALSFLGIGAPMGAATLGSMLSTSRGYMLSAPWLMLIPAFSIVIVIVLAHYFGQRLRDRFR